MFGEKQLATHAEQDHMHSGSGHVVDEVYDEHTSVSFIVSLWRAESETDSETESETVLTFAHSTM